MLISKLKPNDSVGFVTFNNRAKCIFEQQYKKDLPSNVFELLKEVKACGGTNIFSGFKLSR